MRRFLLALLLIRFGLISAPALAGWPFAPLNLLPDSSVELRHELAITVLNVKGVKPTTVEPLTLAPTASPAQILPTGSSTLTPNASGGYTPYQSLSAVGPGTIWPGLGTVTVTNLPTGVHTFTLIVTDSNSQTATGTVSVTVSAVNTPPTTTGIANQTASVGQRFSLNIAPFFTDAETPNSLILSVIGLPEGLSFVSPDTIMGIPSATVGSPFNITAVARDPGGLSVQTSFQLSVSPLSGCSSMYSLKAGSWTDVGVWSCGRLPIGTDVVTLKHPINLPANYQGQALRMLYSSTGRLLMEANSKLLLGGN